MYWPILLFIGTTMLWDTCHCYHSLLLSNTHDIRMIKNPARPRKHEIIAQVPGANSAYGLDYCYNDSLICWAEVDTEEINCIFTPNDTTTQSANTNKVTYAKTGSSMPQKLAIDWLTKNVYWTEGSAREIEVMSLKTRYRKVLIRQDLYEPRAIAVDPLNGLLFWSDWSDTAKIERCSMNGDPATREVILSEDIRWPNGISLDVDAKKLYWIDGKLLKIEVTDYNGKNRIVLLNEGLSHAQPYSVTRFMDLLYWTDWKTSSIHAYNMTTGGHPLTVVDYSHNSLTPIDLKIFDPSLQPYKATPCDINNGGCSHLCLLSSQWPNYSCACPTGIRLINESTCAAGVNHMLLIVQRSKISSVSLDTQDYTTFKLPLKGIKQAVYIDYDPIQKYVYWSTDGEVGGSNDSIQRAQLDGKNRENLVTENLHQLEGFTVDYVARNIYLADYYSSRIEVLRLNNTHRKAIVVDDIDHPAAIAVSPQHTWLWWTDCSDTYPKIERSDLDGSNRFVLIKDGIKCPNSIALDVEENKLYWGDQKQDTIEVANMISGENRRILVNENLSYVWGMAILGDFLYWTDYHMRTLERVNKHSGQDRSEILGDLPDVTSIKAIDTSAKLPQSTNACSVNNGGCDQFCFYKSVEKVAKCSCQIDYELESDSRSCVISSKFAVIHSVDHLRKVSIRNDTNTTKNSSISEIIPLSGIESINVLDIDIADLRIYYADGKTNVINRMFLNGSLIDTIIKLGNDSPKSLAVDSLSSNLYWADADSRRIEVSKLNGKFRKILFWKNLKEPRNLALDPLMGYMYWSEWDGTIGGIFKAAMDGSSKTLFVSDVGKIYGLAVDSAGQHSALYWSQYRNDEASVEFCDSTGNHRKRIVTGDRSWIKFTSVWIHGNYLYWSSANNGSIMRADKFTGANIVVFYRQSNDIVDFKIIDLSIRNGTRERNACTNNKSCKNLCLVKPSASSVTGIVGDMSKATDGSCSCPTHYQLKNGNCHAPENFLLFWTKNTLHRLVASVTSSDDNDDQKECPEIALPPVAGMRSVSAIEYDPLTKYLYWIDGKAQAIKKCHENGSHTVVVVNGDQTSETFNFHDIALDPFNKLLFWTCSLTDTINVIHAGNKKSIANLARVFIASAGEKPRFIALHAEKSLLFWTDDGSSPCIRRSLIDGQQLDRINTGDKIVESIVVDRKLDLLFYSYDQEIFSCSLSGDKKISLGMTFGKKISSLSIIDSYLYYWIEYEEIPPSIERIDKHTGQGRITILNNVLVSDIVGVRSLNRTDVSNHPCTSRDTPCSYICIRSDVKSNCSCPLGMKLNEDERTCSKSRSCNENHFKCIRETVEECLSNSRRCDGTFDCDDGSDESNCSYCSTNEFQCSNGHCIEFNAVCDGKSDCLDNSDEWTCCTDESGLDTGLYFRCSSDNKCIPKSTVCDGVENCDDGSDEKSQSCNHQSHPRTNKWSDSFIVAMIILVFVVGFVFIYLTRKRKKCKRDNIANDRDRQVALKLLTPNGRQIITSNDTEIKSSDGDDVTSQSQKIAVPSSLNNNRPLDPHPSPTSTFLREHGYCRLCWATPFNHGGHDDGSCCRQRQQHRRGVDDDDVDVDAFHVYNRIDYEAGTDSSYKFDPFMPRSSSSNPSSHPSSVYFALNSSMYGKLSSRPPPQPQLTTPRSGSPDQSSSTDFEWQPRQPPPSRASSVNYN